MSSRPTRSTEVRRCKRKQTQPNNSVRGFFVAICNWGCPPWGALGRVRVGLFRGAGGSAGIYTSASEELLFWVAHRFAGPLGSGLAECPSASSLVPPLPCTPGKGSVPCGCAAAAAALRLRLRWVCTDDHAFPDQAAAIALLNYHKRQERGARCLGNQVSGGAGACHCQLGQGCHDLGTRPEATGDLRPKPAQAGYQGRKERQTEVGRLGRQAAEGSSREERGEEGA